MSPPLRILQLTPGTGSFHCGSCLRDHTLAAALRRLGDEATTLSMYLPPVLDHPETRPAPDVPVFFGGVRVYLAQHSALFRRAPEWVGRLMDAPGVLRLAARRAGATDAGGLGALTVSMLRGEQGYQARELEALVTWLREHGRPDVVLLSNALVVGLARRIREGVGVPVVCTLQGEDAFLDGLDGPWREEAWRVLQERARDVDAFIAVSGYYGRTLQRRLGLPAGRLHVVANGIDPRGLPTSAPEAPVVGYLARMCPQKGLHTLVDAFLLLRRRGRVPGARLRVGGVMTAADRPYVAAQRRKLAEAGLDGDVELRPNLDWEGKVELLRGLSVLSVPATYGEAFGLYVLEAQACGIPVVQPRHAAFEELLEATGGGLLCAPDDPASLAGALEQVLTDEALRGELGRRGREAVRTHFHAERMAREVRGVLQGLLPERYPTAMPRRALAGGMP